MKSSKCWYRDQDATLTLREGIQEYYRANPHLLFPPDTEKEAVHFFRCHDRIHVVFGCDTSFLHEVRADFWTFFGSDLGKLKYLSFLKSPAIQLLMKDLKEKISNDPAIQKRMRAELRQSAPSAVLVPCQVFARTRKMKKKWPWNESETLLDRSLKEIRDEYGIHVFE
jgi:hypothetical protein